MLFCCLPIFFQNQFFQTNYFRNIINVSNSLDPDQACRFVRPDLGPNCLKRLSAEDTGRQRVKMDTVSTEVEKDKSHCHKLREIS